MMETRNQLISLCGKIQRFFYFPHSISMETLAILHFIIYRQHKKHTQVFVVLMNDTDVCVTENHFIHIRMYVSRTQFNDAKQISP